MAEVAFKPDEIIIALEAEASKLNPATDQDKLRAIREQITQRQQELMKQANVPAMSYGGSGYYTPSLNVYSATDVQNRASYLRQEELKKQLAGKIQLLPQGDTGVYRAVRFNEDGTTTDISQGEGNKLTFFDAQGNPLSAAQVAQTATGRSYASAGWDVGFGSGNLPEGTAVTTTKVTSNNVVATSAVTSTPALTMSDVEKKAKMAAQEEFRAALTEMGLADLADVVDSMIKNDYTAAQIKLELPKTKEYTARFPGMEALRKAGRAINEATYIANERAYTQTLRAYGLDASMLGNRTALGTYIANEVSPREFEERVDIAATRVKNNPDVLETFKIYYPEVDQSGVIAYMLNPKAGLDIIKKQVRTSEIGSAAVRAGFAQSVVSATEAANLVPAVGEGSYAQISLEFQRARQLAQSQRRLAEIERQQYSDLEAIGAVVGDNVQNIMASERRAAREVARFGGTSGLTSTSLRSAATTI